MNPKIAKINQEIQKHQDRIQRSQERIRELEQQRTELENTEIIGLVRSIRATPEDLAELLRSMKSKGVSSYD